MKYLSILMSTLIFVSSVFAVEKDDDFEDWLSHEEFNLKMKTIPKEEYPISIEAKALLGDGVVFRAKLNRKLSDELKYEYIFNKDKRTFNIKNKQLIKDGYKLNNHQVVQLQAFKSHQAVWVLDNKNKKKMKQRSQIFKERYEKYEKLLLLFPKSPFVINNGSLVVLKNTNIQNLDKQKAIINLALKSLVGMDIPDGCKVVVQDKGNISIVTFENKLPEGALGGDYIAEIKIDTKEMKMIEMLVGS